MSSGSKRIKNRKQNAFQRKTAEAQQPKIKSTSDLVSHFVNDVVSLNQEAFSFANHMEVIKNAYIGNPDMPEVHMKEMTRIIDKTKEIRESLKGLTIIVSEMEAMDSVAAKLESMYEHQDLLFPIMTTLSELATDYNAMGRKVQEHMTQLKNVSADIESTQLFDTVADSEEVDTSDWVDVDIPNMNDANISDASAESASYIPSEIKHEGATIAEVTSPEATITASESNI